MVNKPEAVPRRPIAWTRQQSEALAAIKAWHRAPDRAPTFYLAGYAGSGKTTLAQAAARRIGGRMLYAAYTGKAAHVLRRMGCDGATTIDLLIYKPVLTATCTRDPPCDVLCVDRCRYRRERFVGREINLDSVLAGANLLIIDEVSMIGEEMAGDLLSYAVPILVLGDPAQLPPIGDAGYFTDREPDYLLTEIQRQAFGSPIIDLATRVRNRQQLRLGRYGDSAVIARLSDNDLLDADQIIVGTHRIRCVVNRAVRKALGFHGDIPEPGEKLICLKNDRRKGLRNGELFEVVAVKSERHGFLDMEVRNDVGQVFDVWAPVDAFGLADGSGSELSGSPFTFGYATTAHKAQGSQWDSVLVIDESRAFGEHQFEWLYTALTRAVERVTVML